MLPRLRARPSKATFGLLTAVVVSLPIAWLPASAWAGSPQRLHLAALGASEGWSAPIALDPAFGGTSVSCVSASFCVAVGGHENDDDEAGGDEVITFNGSAWSSPTSIDPGHTLTAVSCALSSFCAAVDESGDALTYDNSGWSAPTQIDNDKSLASISCASASFCVAVDKSGDVITYNGSSWSTPDNISSEELRSISCPSSSFCAAVTQGSKALIYNGSSWSAPVNVVGEVPIVSCASSSFCELVGWNGETATYNGSSWSTGPMIGEESQMGFSALSCPSASFCTTIDQDGYATTYNGSSWSKPTWVPGVNALAQSVSCVSASFCAAVSGQFRAVTYNGVLWDNEGEGVPLGSGGLGGISCPSTSFCAAVDHVGDALTYADGSWSAPRSVDPGDNLEAVSCVSASFCAAVDDSGNALTYNGSSWSAPVTIDSQGGIDAVSCASSSFCMAVDRAGYSMAYNGSAWSAPQQIDTTALYALSCPLSSFCVAVDLEGRTLIFDGVSWSAPQSHSNSGMSNYLSVSCAYTSFCLAGGYYVPSGSDASEGVSLTYNGSSWSTPSTIKRLEPESISCRASFFCLAASGGSAATYATDVWSTPSDIDQRNLDGEQPLFQVSCATTAFCVMVDGAGNALTYTSNAPVPPSNSEAPTITGNAQQNQTLSANHGSWNGVPTAYAYQWERCQVSGANCEAIMGATGQTYTLTAADVGSTVRLEEWVVNAGGSSDPSASAVTAPVTTGEEDHETPTPRNDSSNTSVGTSTGSRSTGLSSGVAAVISSTQIAKLLSQQVAPSGRDATIPALLKHGGLVMPFNAPEAGTLSVQWYEVPAGAKLAKHTKAKPVLVASGQMTFAAAGMGKLKIGLTADGKRLLRHAKQVKLEVQGRFAVRGGAAVSATRAVVIRN
jgi:hypothetical protein